MTPRAAVAGVVEAQVAILIAAGGVRVTAWCRFKITFARSSLLGTQNSLTANRARLARKPTPR